MELLEFIVVCFVFMLMFIYWMTCKTGKDLGLGWNLIISLISTGILVGLRTYYISRIGGMSGFGMQQQPQFMPPMQPQFMPPPQPQFMPPPQPQFMPQQQPFNGYR